MVADIFPNIILFLIPAGRFLYRRYLIKQNKVWQYMPLPILTLSSCRAGGLGERRCN
jgi:hypothetical protein